MSIFEAGMMVCFGASWPIAALKTYKCKCVHGKSLKFSLLILPNLTCTFDNQRLTSLFFHSSNNHLFSLSNTYNSPSYTKITYFAVYSTH